MLFLASSYYDPAPPTQAHGHNTFENGHCTGPIYQRLKEAGRRFEDQKKLKLSPTSEKTCKFLVI